MVEEIEIRRELVALSILIPFVGVGYGLYELLKGHLSQGLGYIGIGGIAYVLWLLVLGGI